MRPTLLILTLILLLIFISLPYFQAASAAGEDFVFNGFLLNPLDGNSYLAKMYQGWRGDWRFTLPFSAEPGVGTWLFLFYIFLGHLARWLSLPLLSVFHGARLLAAIVLSLTLYAFFKRSRLPEDRQRLAFIWVSFGAGLGWLLAPMGLVTSDYWVAEAFPFLSSYANPHFPLSLALLLGLFWLDPERSEPQLPVGGRWFQQAIFAGLLALGLAVISPFGVVLAALVLGGLMCWQALAQWQRAGRGLRLVDGELSARLTGVLLGGIPLLIYDWWVVRHHPALAIWDAQNLTRTPPLWDLALSLAPAWLLALPGSWKAVRSGGRLGRLLVAWAALAAVLLAAPLGLQRRFMLGLYIPLVILAAWGLEALAERMNKRLNLLALLALGLALPTNLFLLLAAQHGIQSHDRLLYRTRSEEAGLNWIRQETPAQALVLAAPEIGLLIPAWTGRRVIYGHPFETVNAVAEEQAVIHFYTSSPCDAGFLQQRAVMVVFWGPREAALSGKPALNAEEAAACKLQAVFQQEEVLIYRVLGP